MTPFPLAAAVLLLLTAGSAAQAAGAADPARAAILSALEAEARSADPGFSGFSAERGAALFSAKSTAGKPDTPSCTTCHSDDPRKPGQTRAGKDIHPMAVSVTPDRFTDAEKVAKWFERNCHGVLGRPCTPLEKGDFLTFMISR
jgi:hypothetical protein